MLVVSRVLTWPVVVVAFVVDRLRRLPGARSASRARPWILGGMIVAAVLLLLAWGVEASPVRMSMRDLTAGQLPAMQSWIIVSGQLADDPASQPGEHRYLLTDPGVPRATLYVISPHALPLGPATISGRILGGREVVPEGSLWSAILTADDQLANEILPPPVAFGLLVAVVVIAAAGRTRYPMFVGERPATAPRIVGPVRIGVRRDAETSSSDAATAVPGTLRLDPGSATPITLRIDGRDETPLRVHSARTGLETGELRGVRWFAPALRLRMPLEDLTLTFASRGARDATYAILVADAETAVGS